ncbi:hypothetical protein [Xanthomonas translucens]|uniref:hypothetical protein n=1 Tax=Xanthomonas campestris pv. translucens TaxID=343 RepID=UPI000ADAB381|nr:hypothetical protein [Xanthomonas translucens]
MTTTNKRVIAVEPEDGSTAYGVLPAGYVGPAAMQYEGSTAVYWAVFPSAKEAITAACIANRHDMGGYRNVKVHLPTEAPADAKHFATAEDWFIE